MVFGFGLYAGSETDGLPVAKLIDLSQSPQASLALVLIFETGWNGLKVASLKNRTIAGAHFISHIPFYKQMVILQSAAIKE